MNAKGADGQRAQVDTIYKHRDLSQQRMFKSVKHDDISRFCKLSLLAIEEQRKFQLFLDKDPWPKEMETLR